MDKLEIEWEEVKMRVFLRKVYSYLRDVLSNYEAEILNKRQLMIPYACLFVVKNLMDSYNLYLNACTSI